jgi:choline transport protein
MFWVLAPRNTAEVVFTQFTDGGGWPSMGLALMVGQITALYACICSDAAAHMSEEIKVCLDATICFGKIIFADFTIRMLVVPSPRPWSALTSSAASSPSFS